MDDELRKVMEEASRYVLAGQAHDQLYVSQQHDASFARWLGQPMKLIFLDFDGVLNSDLSVARFGTKYQLAEENVAELNALLAKSGAMVVISTSWRNHWTVKENSDFLARDGVRFRRVVGKTPTFRGKPRGDEIAAWLKEVPFAVESFVILDDKDDMPGLMSRLVQTDPGVGLQEGDVERALQVLNATG